MNIDKILTPLMETIDKVIFGFEEINEAERHPDFMESENDEEFDVQRSIN